MRFTALLFSLLFGFFAFFLAVPVDAQSCAPTVEVDRFSCFKVWDNQSLNLFHCEAQRIGRNTESCNQSTCRSNSLTCSSNDSPNCQKVGDNCLYTSPCSGVSCSILSTPPPGSTPTPPPSGGGGQCGTGCGCYSLGGGSCPGNRPTNLGVNAGECSGGQTLCCESGPCSGGGGGGGNSTPSCNGSTNVQVSVNGGAWTPNDVTIDWGDMLGFGGSASGGQNISVWPKTGAQTCSNYPGYGNPCPNFVFITGSFWGPVGSATSFVTESWVPQGAWWAGAGTSCPDYLTVTVRACLAPSAPTLVSPSNGTVVPTSTAYLTWNPIADSSWGCANQNRSYRVYVSTNPSSFGAAVATVSEPLGTPDTSYTFLGNRGQTYYWRVTAVNGAGAESAPSTTWSFSIPNLPWWQVDGGGVTAAGGGVASEVYTGERFVKNPAAVVVSNGAANFNGQEVSSTRWLAQNTALGSSVVSNNGYDDLERNVLGYLTPTNVPPSSIASVNQLLVGTPVNGVRYLMVEGDLSLATGGALDLTNNKIVLLVRGNVTINNNINLTDNQGFFMLGASGNILISPNIGAVTAVSPGPMTPHLEGVFLAGGTFYTGSGTRQLRLDGSVVGIGGVVMERSVVSQYPGEYFFFRPEMAVYMPRETLRRNLNFEEVAP